MKIPFEIRKDALKKALGVGAAIGGSLGAMDLFDPEEAEAATWADIRKVVQRINSNTASLSFEKGSKTAKRFGQFASQELRNLKDIPEETYKDIDVEKVSHLKNVGWAGVFEINPSQKYQMRSGNPKISIPELINKGPGSVPGTMDVEPNYYAASAMAHEMGHGWQFKHGIYGVNAATVGGDDPFFLASYLPKSVIPEVLNSKSIPSVTKNKVVDIFHRLYQDPDEVTSALQELGYGMHTVLHTPGEVLSAVYDGTVTGKIKDLPLANKYFGKLGKYMLAVPSVAALAVGIDQALQETGMGGEAEAAPRIHFAPKKINKLLPLAEAPLREGTGGMREGAGLYTTEIHNKEVQDYYKSLFKSQTATPERSVIPGFRDTVDKVDKKLSVLSGLYESKNHIKTLKRLSKGDDDIFNRRLEANITQSKQDIRSNFISWKTAQENVLLGEGDDGSEAFYHTRLDDAIGRLIGYKQALKRGVEYFPREEGIAYKHIINTTRDDADFLWRHKILKEQPQILTKIDNLMEKEGLLKERYIPTKDFTGAQFQEFLADRFGDVKASELLHNYGIAGARYLINGGKGPGFNEILFAPHKDALIVDIIKLGVPITVATAAVQSAYESEAEASPGKLLEAGSKLAQKVVKGDVGVGGLSGVMKEAWKYTFPAGPYKGKTINSVVKSANGKTFYLQFEDDTIGRLDKEEAKLLAQNLGIKRYLNIFDAKDEGSQLRYAKGRAVDKATRNAEILNKTGEVPAAAEATPLESLEKVSKMGLEIHPYKQVEYKGQKFDLPTQYANLLLSEGIVTLPGETILKKSGLDRVRRAKGI
jgi:hypothetical protein